MNDSVRRLYEAVRASRGDNPTTSRTARLLHAGTLKISKKLAEEAVEVALEAAAGKRGDVIRESADLMYHLVVLWVEADIQPKEVWAELDRRERLFGIAEKLPKKQGVEARNLLQAKPHERARRAHSR